MTEAEAKEIIKNDTPGGDTFKRLEALGVAFKALGNDARMSDVYRWADGKEDGKTEG